jgi:hypothetical protein
MRLAQTFVVLSNYKQDGCASLNYFWQTKKLNAGSVRKTNMKAGIRIIKRNAAGDATDLQTATAEKSVEQTTREMVSTVKSWIAEVQQRKRTERHSLLECGGERNATPLWISAAQKC